MQLVAAGCKTRLTTFSIYPVSRSHDIWIFINLLCNAAIQFFTFRLWIIVFVDTVIINTADSFACSANCRLTAASSSPPVCSEQVLSSPLSLARVTVMLPCNLRDPHHQHCETDIIIRRESGDVSSVTRPAGVDAFK